MESVARKKLKILIVFGTRPEAIKMCPIVKELKVHSEVDTVVCVTGQHQQMLNQVLEAFSVVPQYNMEIMKEKQTLFDITNLVLDGMRDIVCKEKPDAVLVHGDTTSAFVAALACYYMKIPVCHVEAGLRTYDQYSPYPEEFNRHAIDSIADIFFVPTENAKNNLLREGKADENIYVTGNTVIDALKTTVSSGFRHELLEWAGQDRLILVTAHRRENIGKPMKNMFTAIKNVLEEFDDVKMIYPMHLNPEVQEIANEVFTNTKRIKLIEPLDVVTFHNFMNYSYLVMTDSGGIQEEAPSLGKPVLVMRDTTERPEGVEAGTLLLVGTEQKRIEDTLRKLLKDKEMYDKMSHTKNPYGDGTAAKKIVQILLERNKVHVRGF